MKDRLTGEFTAAGLERLVARISLMALAAEARIDPSRYSKAERGLLALTAEEESARKRALEVLKARIAVEYTGHSRAESRG